MEEQPLTVRIENAEVGKAEEWTQMVLRGATQLDIMMITCLVAQEQTKKQFEGLLNAEGFKLVRAVRYTQDLGDNVLVAVSL